ncbi:MAG: ribonuclease P protein component [Candidatus Pacebacteria bacterium]|nr:ribonuclease P protein component [Candidatus Paceibacterota bacterium]
MLSLKNRLKKEKDFERVFKQGKAAKNALFFLKGLDTGSANTRFGFIVSKKVSKKAVIRNKAKRWMRVIARENLPKIKKGYDIIITAYPKIAGADINEARKEIGNLFSKAGLFKQ